MDHKEYKKIYDKLLTKEGRYEFSQDTRKQDDMLARVNTFLDTYPTFSEGSEEETLPDMSLRTFVSKTVQTMIDMIHDISLLVSSRSSMGNVTFRREVFKVVTEPSRRVFVGVWLVFFSFVLYFIDSAA